MGNKIRVNGPGHITKTAATPINGKKSSETIQSNTSNNSSSEPKSDDFETWHGTFGMQSLKSLYIR